MLFSLIYNSASGMLGAIRDHFTVNACTLRCLLVSKYTQSLEVYLMCSKNCYILRDHTLCYLMQTVVAPSTVWSVPVPLSRPQCCQTFICTHTFILTCKTDRHKSDQRTYQCTLFLTCEPYMHGWARHLLPSQARSYLRIAFIWLRKRNITDPCPISLFTSTYCT